MYTPRFVSVTVAIVWIGTTACGEGEPTEPLSIAASVASESSAADRDHYIVTLDSTVDADATAKALGQAYHGQIGYIYKRAINGFSIRLPEAAAAALERNPHVASVEPVGIRHLTGVQSWPPWGLDRIDQTNLPLNQSYSYAGTGWNYTAYVFDTGVRTTHVDFGGRASTVWTVADGTGGIDCNGHGTHVAGTIGGVTYGVAKQVKIAALRVFGAPGCNSAFDSDIIAAIDWLIANRRLPAVANMSLGGSPSPALDAAVNRLIASGVAVVVSAGNDATDACTQSPARVPAAVTVAASDIGDRRSAFSNWGACVDIFAPGTSIVSTYNRSNTDFATLQGTSMAGPHVAGAVAYTQEPVAANAVTQILAVPTINAISDARTGTPNRLLNTNNLAVSCGRSPCLPSPIDSRLQAVGIGGPFTLTEGSAAPFAISGASDPSLTYVWDFGDFSTAAGPAATHSYADNDSYVVSLTVSVTADAVQSVTLTTSAVVGNASPVVNAGTDASITSGRTFHLDAAFSDAGLLDSPWAYAIDWADGSAELTGTQSTQGTISAERRYVGAGQYLIRVTVNDKDGGTGSDVVIVTVNRLPVTINLIPADPGNTVHLKSKPNELIPVAVLSSPSFDATTIDATSVTLGNATGAETGIARDRKGAPVASTADVNSDGRPDRLFSFAKNELVRLGDLNESTLQLIFRATLGDGTQIQGADGVRVLSR